MAKEPHAPYEYEIDFCEVKEQVDAECQPQCTGQWQQYVACAERIKNHHSDDGAHHDCASWYVDYWKCIDHCAANKLFARLK